ncbi:MAG: squalene/phytoene synthase family protein, partial [Elusimicrobia bacterium]|nr:squalene/phytoene synthase family protein [Elusimicrobiota bacterium]
MDWDLLKRVSRSMYLSLRVLPEAVRPGMGLGYLLCRAADTIADTRLVPNAERRGALEAYRAAFAGGKAPELRAAEGFAKHQASASEKELLGRLGECVRLWEGRPERERALLADVVFSVVDGMRMDLERFPSDDESGLAAFASEDDLDRYCGCIGGGPGLFWTGLLRLHVKKVDEAPAELDAHGFRLGKGLQITNILRDVPKDLRLGRCYLPEPDLARAGLTPRDLLDPANAARLRPVLQRWLSWALGNLDAGREYVARMPTLRLRAAAAWPLLLSVR